MISDTTTSARYRVTNGVLSYGIPFRIYSGTDVAVFWSADARADTELTLGTHYTVAILTEGGMVNLLPDVVPVGSILAVVSNIPATQEADFSSTSTVSTAALEMQMDRTVQMIQQLNYLASRSVILPATSDETPQDVVQNVYAARDDATAAASSASGSQSAAAVSASDAAQSALEAAAAVPDNLVARVTNVEAAALDAQSTADAAKAVTDFVTTTPTPNAVPQADADGKLDEWVSPDAGKANINLENVVPGIMFGHHQAWQDVTVNRAFDATYSNDGSRAILVSLSYYYSTSASELTFYINDAAHSRICGNRTYLGEPQFEGVIVPPGATYKVSRNPAAGVLTSWREYR